MQAHHGRGMVATTLSRTTDNDRRPEPGRCKHRRRLCSGFETIDSGGEEPSADIAPAFETVSSSEATAAGTKTTPTQNLRALKKFSANSELLETVKEAAHLKLEHQNLIWEALAALCDPPVALSTAWRRYRQFDNAARAAGFDSPHCPTSAPLRTPSSTPRTANSHQHADTGEDPRLSSPTLINTRGSGIAATIRIKPQKATMTMTKPPAPTANSPTFPLHTAHGTYAPAPSEPPTHQRPGEKTSTSQPASKTR